MISIVLIYVTGLVALYAEKEGYQTLQQKLINQATLSTRHEATPDDGAINGGAKVSH
jgi:hypothetical protein